jgi:hypothetical protein
MANPGKPNILILWGSHRLLEHQLRQRALNAEIIGVLPISHSRQPSMNGA